jgi:hypothetical protein
MGGWGIMRGGVQVSCSFVACSGFLLRVVGAQVVEQGREAALRDHVALEERGKRVVAERLGEAGAQRLASSVL